MKRLLYICIALLVFAQLGCSDNDNDKVSLPAPVINSISPLKGRPGSIVTITGENFSRQRVDNTIEFMGQKARIVHFNTNTIHVEVPQGGDTGPIRVVVAGQSSEEGPSFEYIQPPAPTGETVVVKVLSVAMQPTQGVPLTEAAIKSFGVLADELQVDFMVAREVDSSTTRSQKIDRALLLANEAKMPNHFFVSTQAYQTGKFGISVYSRHPIVSQELVTLLDNRIMGLLTVQLTSKSQIAFGGVQMEDVVNRQDYRNRQAGLILNRLNDVMIPTILAGNFFLMKQIPTEDETFKHFADAGYIPGCQSCAWTFPANATVNSIADMVMFKWARESRIIKYENITPPAGMNRQIAYAEIEFSL